MSRRAPIVEDGVIAGNFDDKYHSRNPIARFLVNRFERAVTALADRTAAQDVHEVGCGEGYLTEKLLAEGRRVRGSDFSRQVVEVARRRAEESGLPLQFRAVSVHDLDPDRDAAELVVCCEVLEHVEDPGGALARLADVARPWLLVSVPREPLWRVLNCARGKYLSALGNTPGHLQHWSSRSFVRFLRRRVDVVEVRRPVPWTVALCRSRRAASG